jgi:hypothetical protein
MRAGWTAGEGGTGLVESSGRGNGAEFDVHMQRAVHKLTENATGKCCEAY